MSKDIFGCHNLRGLFATGIEWVGVRDVTQHPTRQRKPKCHNAEGEELICRFPLHPFSFPSTLPVGELDCVAWGVTPSLSVTDFALLAQFSMALSSGPHPEPVSDSGSVPLVAFIEHVPPLPQHCLQSAIFRGHHSAAPSRAPFWAVVGPLAVFFFFKVFKFCCTGPWDSWAFLFIIYKAQTVNFTAKLCVLYKGKFC